MPFQCIPHFDGTDMNNIAVLHYLCEPRHGGTAFYSFFALRKTN